MKNFLIYSLLLVLAGEIIYLAKIRNQKSDEAVLAVATSAPTIRPTESPTPTTTPEPTSIPTAAPTKRPTPTPLPQPLFSSQEIYEFTNRFGGQYGVDPNVIRHIAQCESGFNPSAKYLNYAGLFQFAPTTWKNMRIKMGEDSAPDLRFNAEEAVQTAAYALSIGSGGIWPNCNP